TWPRPARRAMSIPACGASTAPAPCSPPTRRRTAIGRARCSATTSPGCSPRPASSRCCGLQRSTATSAISTAPTGISWGYDNRTLGFRIVGHGASTRVEGRIPGADANSYHAFAGTIAGGLYGIRHRLELGPAFVGNGYEATDIPRVPTTLVEAIELWEHSAIARECFGDDVHHHILTTAKGEWAAFNQSVTDWELRRYWERI
ncbi:MAG TPA: hypothetical protein PLV68_11120, partial [Ilumatobacteraceae bacterium]|nr:hypothetical protein [Ilumatobacteraceae bacterium]